MNEAGSIRRAFSNSACDYETIAVVQKRVRKRMLDVIDSASLNPSAVLDIGAGTGVLLEDVSPLYPKAGLVALDSAFEMNRISSQCTVIDSAVTADAEMLPFRNESFDLVISSSAFQWLSSLEQAFSEAFRVIEPNGTFIFSLFGGETLFELRSSYKEAVKLSAAGSDRTRSFYSIDDVEAALVVSGFNIDRVWMEEEKEEYPSVLALLRAIKGIGASTASSPLSSFAEAAIMKRMITIYCEKFANGANIPATYHVIYGMAKKLTKDEINRR